MKVLILYDAPNEGAAVEEQDVLTQRDTVAHALEHLGNEAPAFGCSLNLEAVREAIENEAPEVVFNLTEALGGTDRLSGLVPLLLDAYGVPYTGACAEAILATASKTRTKQRLKDAGLPTPDWVSEDHPAAFSQTSPPSKWIIKPIWEHASVDMDDESIVAQKDVEAQLEFRQQSFNRPLFAEQFVEGREFNLSVLSGKVLPPAEIDFDSFPEGKPRIVGHKAKWDQESFEYQQTPRRFDFPTKDGPLLEKLTDLARKCWDLFELRGFARVDFRVDSKGQPWILEININPCLSPDAGFAAALIEAGVPFSEAIQQIVADAFRPPRSVKGTGRR